MRTLIALLLVATTLAGCSDAPAVTDDGPDFGELDVVPTATTGVIRGLVVDETIAPIAGAKVVIVGETKETTSNDAGLFGFRDLEAGTYFLEISKSGYASVQQSAEVSAAIEPAITKVQLIRIPGTEPAFVQHSYEGYIACGLQAGNRLIGADVCNPVGLHGEDDADPLLFIDGGPPDFYQSEITWEHTQEFGRQLTSTQYTCDDASCDRAIGSPDRFCQVWGPAPLLCRVTPAAGWGNADGTGGGEGIATSRLGAEPGGGYVVEMRADCTVCVPATALGVGLILEQNFLLYNHLFYNFEPAEEWRFLTDGAPTVPS